jgi:iron-sulfur cluster assembly protein
MFNNFQPIGISERAASEIKRIMANKGIPLGYGLRVGVRGGGCGVSLMIGFDKQKDSDVAYQIEGIPVFLDKKHTMYLIGKEVDFIETADARGFAFIESSQKS